MDDKNIETWRHGFVSRMYWDRYALAGTLVKKSLKLLLLIAVCWTPTGITHPDIRPMLLTIGELWLIATVVLAIEIVILGHIFVIKDVLRWAKRNMADRKSTILLMLFPGALMDAWAREYAAAKRLDAQSAAA